MSSHPGGFALRAALRPVAHREREPYHSGKDQNNNQPTHDICELSSADGGPSELPQTLSAIYHPMPTGVRYQRRQNDRPDPFGDDKPEQDRKHRDQQQQHEELPEFDTNIE